MCGLDTIFLFNIMEGYIQLFATSSDLVFQTRHEKTDIMINESYAHCLMTVLYLTCFHDFPIPNL